MRKSKSSIIVLFCFITAGISLAQEAINIDLNAQGDDTTYTNEGAIAGETVWQAIYEGTGVAVGSARTAYLADYDEPNKVSVYAAQVWLTIPEDGLFDKVNNGVTGNDLMDDGFDKNSTTDPCIFIPGEPQDANLPSGAYNGTYDIYVYSSRPTTITLKSPAIGSSSKNVTGTYAGGPITTPANYVLFQDVIIDDGEVGVAGDANTVTIVWNNIINGITLVKKKTPLEIDSSGASMIIEPNMYDVAKETNQRIGEMQPFGPDLGYDADDPCDPCDYVGPALFYLDNGEYMIFDFNCAASDAGSYIMKAKVVPDGNNNASMTIYYYNDAVGKEIEVGTLTYDNPGGTPSPGGSLQKTDTIQFNVFEGSGYFKCALGADLYFNLVDLELAYNGWPPLDCDDIIFYGYDYDSDYNKDCRVDVADLNEITAHWMEDYTPQEPNLPPSPPHGPPCKKTLYIDGVLIGEANAPEWLTWPTDHIVIGAEGSYPGWLFNEYVGKLDDFAIYAGVFSDTQVTAHWNARNNYTSYSSAVAADNPLLWLKLDEADTTNGALAYNSGSADVNGVYAVQDELSLGTILIGTTAGFVAGSNGVELNVNGRVPEIGEANGVCIDVWDGDGVFGEDLDGDVTIELWVNYTDSNDYVRFFQHNGSWNEDGSYGLFAPINDGNTLVVLGGGNVNYMDFDNDINDGQWHHIVITYDSTFPIPPTAYWTYEEQVQMDNPILWLRFEDDTPQDSSGNDNWVGYGSAASIGFEKGGMGSSLYLDGTYGPGVCGCAAAPGPNAPPGPNDIEPFYDDLYAFAPDDITFEMWYKCPAEQDNSAIFFQQAGGWENEPQAPGITNFNGMIRVFCGSQNWYTDVDAKFDFNWHHLVVTYDEEPNAMHVQLYQDGFEKGSNTVSGPDAKLGPELSHLLVGAQNDMFDTYNTLTGYVDEFAIYQGILDPNRILAHYLTWQPSSCHELWERQMMMPWASLIDRNQDCLIDFYDLAKFALEWALCNDPQGSSGCVPNW